MTISLQTQVKNQDTYRLNLCVEYLLTVLIREHICTQIALAFPYQEYAERTRRYSTSVF